MPAHYNRRETFPYNMTSRCNLIIHYPSRRRRTAELYENGTPISLNEKQKELKKRNVARSAPTSSEKSILTNRLPMCTVLVYKKKGETANGKNGNDACKTYAGNKRRG